MSAAATIADLAHVIWFGDALPPLPWLAVKSSLARGGFSQLIFHAGTAALRDDRAVQNLLDDDRVRFAELGPAEIFDDALQAGIGTDASERLRAIYGQLKQPAALANVARLAILHRDGGVYVDADAITIADITDLRRVDGFAGLERIALPDRVRASRNPLRWAQAGALLAVRDGLSRLTHGPQLFERIEGLYALAINNAVMGATPGHATMREALSQAASLDRDKALQRFELGTRLMQRVTGDASTESFVLHPPDVFFPLPPEISWQFFVPRDEADDRHLLTANTRMVHLYDSVARRRLGRPIDAAWFAETGATTPLGRMVAPWLDELNEVYG